MIPTEFEYLRVTTVAEAIGALVEGGEDAKVLAGGHSLIPLMKLRLAFPEILVDIARVATMRDIRVEGDELVIGAAVTYDEVLRSGVVRAECGVLVEVIATIADPQVRHRGTFGGGLAHGDAAGDLPALALALDAVLVVRGPHGEQAIPAREFFVDYLRTALGFDQLLVEVRLPRLAPSWAWAYEKFTRTAQSWAVVGSCVLVQRVGADVVDARVALTNVATVPVRAKAQERAWVERGADHGVGDVLADDVEVVNDGNADPSYRRHLARVLTQRAFDRAIQA